MSRKDAHAFAASLAATLMVSIVAFQAGEGTGGAVPADEIDGDEVQVVAEVDPWAYCPRFRPRDQHRGRVPDPGLAPVNRSGRALGSAAQ